jgi:hypothetical protein
MQSCTVRAIAFRTSLQHAEHPHFSCGGFTSANMLSELDGRPETYQAFVNYYYDANIPLAAIAKIYAHQLLTPAWFAEFSSTRSFDELLADADEIDYPLG